MNSIYYMENIEEYTVDELMKIFQLSKPLTKYEVSSAIDAYKKSKKNNNITAQRFIEAAGKKLLDSIELKTRHESTTYNYNAHSILMHLKQPKKEFTYELDSTPDYLNPTFQNTITRIINLDSKFRDNSYPLLDPITGIDKTYKLNPSTHTTTTLCLEPDKQSSTQYTTYLSDTLINVLSLKLYNISIPYLWYNIDNVYGNNFFQYIDEKKNVLSIDRRDLSNITLLTGQYNLTTDKNNIYTATDKNNIYTAINSKIKKLNMKHKLVFEFESLTRKTKINYYTDYSGNYNKDINVLTPYTILWFNILNIENQNTKANNNLGWKLGFRAELTRIMNKDNVDKDGKHDPSGIPIYYLEFSGYSPLGNDIFFENKTNNIYYNQDNTIYYDISTSKIYYKNEPVYIVSSSWGGVVHTLDNSLHNSPGNIMRVYPNVSGTITKYYKYTAISEAPADLRLTKYLLLSIEDYNNNQLNSGLISIQSTEKYININSKQYELKVQQCPDGGNKNYYQYSTGLSNEIIGITKAQVNSINAIAKIRTTSNKKTVAPTDSIFAIIRIPEDNSILYGQTITNNDVTLLNNERKYFGPVSIGSLRIKLLTEDGTVLNLNKIDWSFALLCRQLYQY